MLDARRRSTPTSFRRMPMHCGRSWSIWRSSWTGPSPNSTSTRAWWQEAKRTSGVGAASGQASVCADRADLALCRPIRITLWSSTTNAAARAGRAGEFPGRIHRTSAGGRVLRLCSIFHGRGLTEVGCWMHARRYAFKALETDEARMGPALHLIARLYAGRGGFRRRARRGLRCATR
jgi:hypothetical protein